MKKVLKQIENRLTSEKVMGRNKQATCKICDREMRSDHLKRHMKVHEKRKNNINVSKEDKNILLEKSDETKEDENKSPRFDMSRIKFYCSESEVPESESDDDLDFYIYSDSEDE